MISDMGKYNITVHDIFWVSSYNIQPCMICDIILSTEAHLQYI